MSENPEIFVGIDISKDTLDIGFQPSGQTVQIPHDEPGITEATRRLREAAPRLVVLEATGGLETRLAASLTAAGVPVAVVNPRQVRDYAKATGQLAKTDRIDAWMLADFARAIRPAVRPMKEMFTRELDDLVTRRRQLVEMRVQESLRLGRASKLQQKSLKSHIAWLDKRIEDLDTDLRRRLRASPAWCARDDLLRSIPGVGATTSATLLAKLPELGTLDRKGIAALAGLAPLANDSGKQRQARHLGWACGGPLRTVHVDRRGYPVQSRPPRFRRPPEGRRETREGRDRRLHAQAPQHHERHGQIQLTLEPRSRLTTNTVAPPSAARPTGTPRGA